MSRTEETMDANKDIQIQVKKIPLFTVHKNGSILKNIFLLRKRSAVDKSSSYQISDEEILLVGRHPHCNITLEHPSISRYHLRIHLILSSHTLSIVDLSSVHGTWVSGKRIEPGVHFKLEEGDTVRIGGSSRIYELHWVPLSQAYDVDEQLLPAVYTIQEEVEEGTHQDEGLKNQLSEDELESLNLSLCKKSHDSPLKTLDTLISSAPNYVSSSCDDIVSVQAPLVVSETKSATEISESLNNQEDKLNWLRDNLSNEIEAQNDSIIKDDPFLVTNCSKSSWDDIEVEYSSTCKTGNENVELFTTVPLQAALVVSEDISETEISGSLKSSEDELIWLRDNLSNEFELQNDSIIKEKQLSVPSCSKSSCDDTHLSPCKTGNGNGEFVLHVPIQVPPLVSESEIEISGSLKDQSNWVRDNLINKLEQRCHGTMNDDDLVSMDLLDAIKMHKKDSKNENISDDKLNKSEDQLYWLRVNLSNESELQNDGIIKEYISVPSCCKSSCDDTDSCPCKTSNGNGKFFLAPIQAPPLVSISEVEISDSLKDQSNWVRDNSSNELEQLCHGTMNDDDLVFMDLLDAIKMHKKDAQNQNISDDNLNKSEDQLNWLRDNLSNEFELQNDGIVNEEHLSVPSCSKSSCDDTDSSPCKTGNGNENFFLTASIQAPLSISEIEISDSLKDQLNWVRDNLSNAFEQLCHGTTNGDDLTSMDPLDAFEMHKKDAKNQNICDDNLNIAEDQLNCLRDNLSNDFEQLHNGIMKDNLISLDLSDAIKTHGKKALKNQNAARSKEIDMANESELENQQKIDDVSVPVTHLVDGVNRDEEPFMPEIAGCMDFNMCCEFGSIDHKESGFDLLTDGKDMDQEHTFTPDISKAHVNLESMKNVVSVSLNLFDSLDGNELEFYTPDKENKNPNACSGKSLLKRWKEDEHNHFTMSKKAVSPIVYKEKGISDFSKQLFTSVDEQNNASNTDGGMYAITDKHDQFVYCEELSLSSLEKDTKSREMKMEESCNSDYPQTIQKTVNSSYDLGKKRWTMVVDTDSLLQYESLKHLKLLEGLRGTQLFVPKTVIRELMDIKSRDNFLKRSTKKVDLALTWIGECMVNTRSWIHTDDEILHSSKAEPEVLETALHLHKEITDRKIIILTNDLTLKIKAMAEGIMCEAAEDFFRSLVNPFSERFLWVGSSARGPTWSFVDDHIMRQKYDSYGFNGSHKLKGLRLLY